MFLVLGSSDCCETPLSLKSHCTTRLPRILHASVSHSSEDANWIQTREETELMLVEI